MRTHFSIDSGGDDLAATLHRPGAHGDPSICVVFISGPSTNRAGAHRLHLHIADELEKRNFASIRFDFRGRGESTGREADVTVPSMIEDVEAVCDHVVRTMATQKLLLVGDCLSSIVGLRVLERLPHVIAGCFLAAPQFEEQQKARGLSAEIVQTLSAYARKSLNLGAWARLLRGEIDIRAVSHAVTVASLRRYRSRRPPGQSPKYGVGPTLASKEAFFLWGSRDPSLTYRRFYGDFCERRRWRHTDSVLMGADRSFSRMIFRQQVTEAVCEWAERVKDDVSTLQ